MGCFPVMTQCDTVSFYLLSKPVNDKNRMILCVVAGKHLYLTRYYIQYVKIWNMYYAWDIVNSLKS